METRPATKSAKSAQPMLCLWSIPAVTWVLLYVVFASSEPRFAPSNPFGYDLSHSTEVQAIGATDPLADVGISSSDPAIDRSLEKTQITLSTTNDRSKP